MCGFCYDEIVWQRQAGQAVRHSRTFAKHVVPAIVKPMHSLWHEVIGFIFCCLAVFFGARTLRSWQRGDSAFMMIGGVICFVILLGYGISSFLRARKISRS